MSPTRTRAERDALTIEITFALVTAAFAGAVGFLVMGSAAIWAPMPRSWAGPWLTASGVVGAVLFVVRVVRVLRRWPGPAGGRPAGRDIVWFQPSQPGRTNPDS
ncbi:DUF6332 family protein [Streptomyces chattanoogensis]|uniref:Uncharacterized protein n=1 Tax=Streptomyces chattanoogensis TaxID=66876 RepID=A0A0N0XXC2_9ACTN|nr:DUF6332 family protein [Streptomyces chattanoogensis]KPC64544.1 hypothetical protein ADL29_11750 [Streptomyces chattanoogensis]